MNAWQKFGAVALALILVLALAAWVVNPVVVVKEEVAEPVGRAINVLSDFCPDGWKDTSSSDIHTPVKSCSRGNWLVILNDDETFSHGVQLNTPAAVFIFDPALVPGWQR